MIEYARKHKIPFFGICFGMQMAIVEYARNVAGIADATSSEFSKKGVNVVGLMNEWEGVDGNKVSKKNDNLGGTMRLGAYPCKIKQSSLAYDIYGGQTKISERHRHRYEVNITYKDQLEAKGLSFSGLSPDGKLTEIIEIKDHPFFIAVQFHPELKSRPFAPHPLFVAFVKSAIEKSHN